MSTENYDTTERVDSRKNETDFHDSHGLAERPIEEAYACVGAPVPTVANDETDFHVSHSEGRTGADHDIGQANRSWLETQDKTLRHVVSVERIRDENDDVYAGLIRSVADYTKARVLRTVLMKHGTVTYADLTDAIGDVTERTIKTKVAELRDEGVLDVGNGRPAAISLPDDDVALLVEDTLAYLD